MYNSSAKEFDNIFKKKLLAIYLAISVLGIYLQNILIKIQNDLYAKCIFPMARYRTVYVLF